MLRRISIQAVVAVPRATAAIAVATLAVALPDELTFRLDSGDQVQRTLSERSHWELDSMLQSFGGAVVADEAPPLTCEIERTVAVTDTFGEQQDGAPGAFTRTFDDLGLTTRIEADLGRGTVNFDAALSSILAERTVRFTRDGDGDYSVEFEEDASADNSLLTGLRADMDLWDLLPGEEVAEGDSWTIEDEALRSLLCIGGAPKLEVDELEGDFGDILPSDVLAMAVAHLGETAVETAGEAEITWSRTIEEDGHRWALLEVEFEAHAEADLSEQLEELVATADIDDPRVDMTLDADVALEGTAQIRWDLDAGRVHSLTLQAESEVTVEMTWLLEMNGEELEFLGEYGLVGEVELGLEVEQR